jgi:hypothetical protein
MKDEPRIMSFFAASVFSGSLSPHGRAGRLPEMHGLRLQQMMERI